MRSGRGLRVKLNGPHSLAPVTDARNGSVVQVPVGDFEIEGKPLLVDRVSVILRGDEDASRAEILHRLVRAAVTELQLESRGTEGE